MANWAKLQEELTGLPVAKRAKHGIHFDKGGGEVLANFSGAPCHYLDGGIWKPARVGQGQWSAMKYNGLVYIG